MTKNVRPLEGLAGRTSKPWKRYPKYRDSDVEWLGAVPQHWATLKAKYLFREIDDRSVDGTETLLAVSEYSGVSPRSGMVEEGEFLTRADSLEGYKRCRQGDLVINIMLAWKRGLGVASESGIVSPAYAVFRGDNSAVDCRFAHYLFRSDEFITDFRSRSTGIIDSRLRMYPEDFGQVCTLLPSISEQCAIAAFLDRETGRIDALIAKKERQIELLQEKRQALITHAVTKGLDPKAKMKDSGVEWLGEIPEGWETLPLRRVVRSFVDYRGRTPAKSDSGIPLITAGAIKNGMIDHSLCPEFIPEGDYDEWMRRGLPEAGDVVITTEAPLAEVAQVMGERVAFAQRIILFKVNRTRMYPDYLRLYYLAASGKSELLSRASGSTAEGIRADRLRASLVIVPPVIQQRLIVEFVISKLSALTAPAEKLTTSLTLLREYRTALISAAVTGKIDVREATAYPESDGAGKLLMAAEPPAENGRLLSTAPAHPSASPDGNGWPVKEKRKAPHAS